MTRRRIVALLLARDRQRPRLGAGGDRDRAQDRHRSDHETLAAATPGTSPTAGGSNHDAGDRRQDYDA